MHFGCWINCWDFVVGWRRVNADADEDVIVAIDGSIGDFDGFQVDWKALVIVQQADQVDSDRGLNYRLIYWSQINDLAEAENSCWNLCFVSWSRIESHSFCLLIHFALVQNYLHRTFLVWLSEHLLRYSNLRKRAGGTLCLSLFISSRRRALGRTFEKLFEKCFSQAIVSQQKRL